MHTRPSKPKAPSSADIQAAINTLRSLIDQDKAAHPWPKNAAAGSLLEALNRMQTVIQSRPDHPDYEHVKAETAARANPAHWHRR
jgi:hypothetical protein